MEDLFNLTVNIDNPQKKNENLNEFRPRSAKSTDRVYKCTLRLLPDPASASPATDSIVSKYTVFLENKMTGEKRELDDPSTVGEPSIFTQTFFSLRNDPNPVLQQNSKQFSRKLRYATLVQILSCPSEPQLVGKILVWRFGVKIANLIQSQMVSENPNEPAINPYSLIAGRYLFLKVSQQGGSNGTTFDSYDGSAFYDSKDDSTKVQCPIETANGVQYVPVTAANCQNEKFREQVQNWLKSSAPSLEPYRYHPMNDADKEFAMSVISVATNPQATIAAAQQQFGVGGFGQKPVTTQVPNNAPGMNLGGMNVGMPGVTPQMTPQQPVAPQVQSPVMNAQAPQAPVSGGFGQSTGVPGGLDEILGGAPSAPQTPPQQPAGGISLNDVLGDILS